MSVQVEKFLIYGQHIKVIHSTCTRFGISRFWFDSDKLSGERKIVDTLKPENGDGCMSHNQISMFQNSYFKSSSKLGNDVNHNLFKGTRFNSLNYEHSIKYSESNQPNTSFIEIETNRPISA